jgi:hypothetical protein
MQVEAGCATSQRRIATVLWVEEFSQIMAVLPLRLCSR